MGCGSEAVKYLLFAFNLVFCLGGIALLVLGSIIQWNIENYGSLFPGDVALPGIILIIVGGITFVVAFVGCCGAIRESVCLILTFAICLMALFILQVTGGILAIVFQSDIALFLKDSMRYAMQLYPLPDEEAARKAWDQVQNDFRCCAIDDPWEWLDYMNEYPESCKCPATDVRCIGGIWAFGCFKDLSGWLVLMQNVLGGIAVTFALFGAIFAICLGTAVRRRMHTAYSSEMDA
ncbi:tetraspanin-4-like [Neocloeon triangulifer]|uniref:tetraspanin-4-like n=1 Tax=Neocloeon triangulifer TaxID=2078957 RepID=UPI00286F199C|nr:tetraspanin-4-like [Neocloeon triangulifer]